MWKLKVAATYFTLEVGTRWSHCETCCCGTKFELN